MWVHHTYLFDFVTFSSISVWDWTIDSKTAGQGFGKQILHHTMASSIRGGEEECLIRIAIFWTADTGERGGQTHPPCNIPCLLDKICRLWSSSAFSPDVLVFTRQAMFILCVPIVFWMKSQLDEMISSFHNKPYTISSEEFELSADSLGAHFETHGVLILRTLSYLTVKSQDDAHCELAVIFSCVCNSHLGLWDHPDELTMQW